MEHIDWRSAAVGAALLPLSWLAATLWKARKSVIQPNTSRVPYKVVITGGSKGLGRALADEFLNLGDEVVIASRNVAACESAVAELQQQHPQGTILQTSCDVSQINDVQQLAEFAQQKLGRIDIWVNNAGVSQIPKASLADTAAEQIQQIVTTNMLGALLGSRIALQTMNVQTSGGRVFLLDGAGSRGTATAKSATYGSTKAAMPQLLRSLAAEVRQSKVSVHLASPGMVATDLLLKGVSNRRAAKIVNILAEDPKVVAQWLVPRMRGVTGNGIYFKYLTPMGVLMRFLTARRRRNRFLTEDNLTKSASDPAVESFPDNETTGRLAAAVQYTMTGVEFECSVVEYPSFIANLPTLQEPHYVLYTANIDDATRQPWCPDCQQADPIVEEVIKQTGGTLLKVKVGDRASWKSEDHPFRQDPQLHLTSIPTLMHWKADSTCPGRRLDNQLESTHSESAIKQAILAFTAKAKEQDA